MKDIMIDIETLATRNDAAIIQIGAVAFDPTSGEFGVEPFLVSVEQSYYDTVNPFYVDERTKTWWRGQSAAAKNSLDINKVATPFIALDKFANWFDKQDFVIGNKRRKSSRVWANPPQFDLSILRFAASKAYGSDNDVPWKYWQETDMRTLVHIGGRVSEEDLGEHAERLTAHRADHDAIRQALIVKTLLDKLRK